MHHRKTLFSLREAKIGRAQNEKSKEYFSVVSCLPSIQAGGGTGLILIEQRKSGIPPNPPFRFSFAQTGRERKQAGKNSFPPTPFLFARLLGLRPQNFRTDGFCYKLLSNDSKCFLSDSLTIFIKTLIAPCISLLSLCSTVLPGSSPCENS